MACFNLGKCHLLLYFHPREVKEIYREIKTAVKALSILSADTVKGTCLHSLG